MATPDKTTHRHADRIEEIECEFNRATALPPAEITGYELTDWYVDRDQAVRALDAAKFSNLGELLGEIQRLRRALADTSEAKDMAIREQKAELAALVAENRELRFRVLHPDVVINDVRNEPTWRQL